tara:strand:- start:176 stop:379 length:204 start_codon:yes stop_codon:yes gene_type:complete
MKLKPNETMMVAFSKHFKRIFGGNTTFGDIAKVKAQQNSTGNLMGSHVESHLKDQKEYAAKQLKESL